MTAPSGLISFHLEDEDGEEHTSDSGSSEYLEDLGIQDITLAGGLGP